MRALLCSFAVFAAACAGPAAAQQLYPPSMDAATFERELTTRFQYGPPEPSPQEVDDRRAGQIADAAYFAAFPQYDRSYSAAARAEATRLAARLRDEAGDLSHEQFALRVAEIVALADNAHTAVGERTFMKDTPRVRLRTFWFPDGVYVLRADASNRDLLGARIEAINGHTVDAVFANIRRYAGGQDWRRRLWLLPILESPAYLQAAGLGDARMALTYSGTLASGAHFERRILAEERNRAARVSSTPRLLYAAAPDDAMASLLPDSPSLPIYLHSRQHLFWSEALPEGGFYVGLDFNGNGDSEEIGPFLDSVMARIRSTPPHYLVVDMRKNGGGDYTTTYAFMSGLPRAVGRAPIYVLEGPVTFSAGMHAVAALKQAGGAQVHLVGDDVGDRLQFWSEGGAFQLPNAFITVYYTAARHNFAGPCTDPNTCFWLDQRYPVRVPSLAPEIRAPLTFAAYREGRDPAMEAVLAREARSGSSARRQ